jgi:Flp pilus assembly pilin Flp
VVHNPRVDRAGGEWGATAVAYAVMIAILALLLVGGVMVLSGSVESAFTDGAQCVSDPGGCGESSGGSGNGNGNNGNGNGGASSTTSTTGPGPTTTTTAP